MLLFDVVAHVKTGSWTLRDTCEHRGQDLCLEIFFTILPKSAGWILLKWSTSLECSQESSQKHESICGSLLGHVYFA